MTGRSDKKILDLIQKADWDDIYPRAIKFAITQLWFLSRSPLRGAPKEQIAHDIVSQAILKIINGYRKWEPDRGPLLEYLFSVIKSDISHLYESEDYVLTSRLPVSPQENSDGEFVEQEELLTRAHELDKHAADIAPDPPPLAYEVLIEYEICGHLLNVIKGDDELENIVLCMLEGFSKPRDIAEQLNVDIKIIYNAKKRLERAYNDLLRNKKEIS